MDIYSTLRKHADATQLSVLIDGYHIYIHSWEENGDAILITDHKGKKWFLAPDQVEAMCIGNVGKQQKDQFLREEIYLEDPQLLADLVEEVKLWEYDEAALLESLRRDFGKTPSLQPVLEELWEDISLGLYLERLPSLHEKLSSLRETYDRHKASFLCLEAHALALSHQVLKAAELFIQAKHPMEALSLLEREEFYEPLLLCTGYYMISNDWEETPRQERIPLRYAALCREEKDVALFSTLLQGAEDLSAAREGAILYLIRKRNPGYQACEEAEIEELVEDLKKAWEIKEPVNLSTDFAAENLSSLFDEDALRLGKGHGESLPPVPMQESWQSFTSKLLKRMNNITIGRKGSHFHMFYLGGGISFQTKIKDLRLSPSLILDPTLGRLLQCYPRHALQGLEIRFVLGKKMHQIAPAYAFLARKERSQVLSELQSQGSSDLKERFLPSPYFAPMGSFEEMDQEKARKVERLDPRFFSSPTPQEDEEDLEVLLFLRYCLCQDICRPRLPSLFLKDALLTQSAQALLEAHTKPCMHFSLGSLLYGLGQQGLKETLSLAQYFRLGLPEENPFHFALWPGQTPDALLKQMKEAAALPNPYDLMCLGQEWKKISDPGRDEKEATLAELLTRCALLALSGEDSSREEQALKEQLPPEEWEEILNLCQQGRRNR